MEQRIRFQDLISNQAFYLHDINHLQASFMAMREEDFQSSSFLDGRISRPKEAAQFKLNLDAVLSSPAWTTRQALHPQAYIFHLSHVGSTLLAKALGESATCLALREPAPLRYLTGQLAEAGQPHSWLSADKFNALLGYVEHHLGRPLGARTEVLVKCTSWVNEIAHLLLKQEQARAVFLYCKLEKFVVNILKPGGGLVDLMGGAAQRIKRLNRLQSTVVDVKALSNGEVAAMTWVCEMLTLSQAGQGRQHAPTWMDFDEYLLDAVAGTAQAAHSLGLHWDAADTQRLVASNTLNKYSKTDGTKSFTPQDRFNDLAKLKAEFASEIDKALTWIEPWLLRHPELANFA